MTERRQTARDDDHGVEPHHHDALRRTGAAAPAGGVLTHPDVLAARIAGLQHGVVATAQLRDAGMGRGAIALRVRNGRLHREHRGVYLWGHTARAPLATEAAAQLAAGRASVLALRSAAFVGGWAPRPPSPELIVPRNHRGDARASSCTVSRWIRTKPAVVRACGTHRRCAP